MWPCLGQKVHQKHVDAKFSAEYFTKFKMTHISHIFKGPGFYGKWVHGIGVVMLAPDKLVTPFHFKIISKLMFNFKGHLERGQ